MKNTTVAVVTGVVMASIALICLCVWVYSKVPASHKERWYEGTLGRLEDDFESRLREAQSEHGNAVSLNRIQELDVQSLDHRTRRVPYVQRTIIEDTYGFSLDDLRSVSEHDVMVTPLRSIIYGGNITFSLQESRRHFSKGTIIYWHFAEWPAYFSGYLGPYIQASLREKDNRFRTYYIPISSLSNSTPELSCEKNGSKEAKWWDLHCGEKKILHRGVKLFPGQKSEILTFEVGENITYDIRSDNDVMFTVWINGKEMDVAPEKSFHGPYISGFGRVQVQLSPFMEGEKTIRFIAERS